MRLLLQRVNKASVSCDQRLLSKINAGFLVLVGFAKNDDASMFPKLVHRLLNVALFDDEQGKMGKLLLEVQGELLIVSQFTLYGELEKGRKVNWDQAMPYADAEALYNQFLAYLKENYFSDKIKSGVFGGEMVVDIQNDGPVTLMLEA
jgi:D-tyrosyl-tRNA(Tyr) deacylase